MKKITSIIIVLLVISAFSVYAQEKKDPNKNEKKVVEIKPDQSAKDKQPIEEPFNTLLGNANLIYGGFLAPVVKISKFDDEIEALAGFRAALIINHSYSIGFAGYGLAGSLNKYVDGEMRKIGIGYGGLNLSYFAFTKSLLNFSIGTLIGAGGIGYTHKKEDATTSTAVRRSNSNDCDCDNSDNYEAHGSAYFIVEPELNINMNITQFFKVGLGVSYRLVAGVNHKDLSNSDINGLSAQIIMSFGWF